MMPVILHVWLFYTLTCLVLVESSMIFSLMFSLEDKCSPTESFNVAGLVEMMRLQTYAGFSFIASIAAIYHAFHSREQFYPAMVYLSTSKICFVLLLNMALVVMCILWQLVKRLFLGTLREAEVERLNEQAWREVMEILFTITLFRQEFSVTSLILVTALLLIKALHWLAQKRVEFIETTPSVTLLSHARMVSFMAFLLVVDCIFLRSSFMWLLETWPVSLALFFSFEYTVLASTIISTFLKYAFYLYDMYKEGQWEKKAVFTFYLELVRDLLHLTLYICFFLVICTNYYAPLHLIRELYETFRSFRTRVADYIRYRKVTSNMDQRFPDATPEELNSNDATCIICREEMITAKKLLCGHLFHVHCLRSWLERQNTCPTCRALIDPSDRAPSRSRQHSGSAAAGSFAQATEGGGAGDSVSQHQARLKAASLAASIYGKSSIYPSPNTLFGSSGYSFLPQMNIPHTGASTLQSNGQVQQQEGLVSNGHPHSIRPSPIPGSSLSTPEAIQARIEMLNRERQALLDELEREVRAARNWKESHTKGSTGDVVPPSIDTKGKSVAASDSAQSGS